MRKETGKALADSQQLRRIKGRPMPAAWDGSRPLRMPFADRGLFANRGASRAIVFGNTRHRARKCHLQPRRGVSALLRTRVSREGKSPLRIFISASRTIGSSQKYVLEDMNFQLFFLGCKAV
jgi:hypothetical protein